MTASDVFAAPQSEAECAEVIKEAAASATKLEITGGGSRSGFGHAVADAKRLSTKGFSGISLYEPNALTIVAGAGTPVREIEVALAAENQQLPFEPSDLRALYGTKGAEPTIGGVVATGASGPRRIQAGACRDSLIGVRFVNGKGEASKSGGRGMKNVTGYDLVKLSSGAHGTLGVLTEVAFKVLPRPEKVATLRLSTLGEDAAVRAMSMALGSPYDVTGAAHFPAGLDGEPTTMIRLEGFANSVDYRAEKLRTELRDLADVDIDIDSDPERCAASWKRVRDAEAFEGRPGAVWRVTVKPTDGPKLVSALREKIKTDGVFYDWGGGLVWVLTPEVDDAGATAIRTETNQLGGKATLVRASEDTRRRIAVFHPEPAVLARMSAGLRQVFDPAGVLNSGRMTLAA
ncbi:MAG: FAD-binding protein [Neomegalonema sp.]